MEEEAQEKNVDEAIEKLLRLAETAEDIKRKSALIVNFLELGYRMSTVAYNIVQLLFQITDTAVEIVDIMLKGGIL